MAYEIRPLARLFRGMADLIDQDHTSHSRYEAIAKAAGLMAARATAQELVVGRLWQVDGADLLAAAYAFHAGLPRQAATAGHVQTMQQPDPAPASAQLQPPPGPAGSAGAGQPGSWDGAAGFSGELRRCAPGCGSAARSSPWRAGPGRCGQARDAPVRAARRPGHPRGQLIRLTGFIAADLAARLLRLLDGGPELVGAQAARIRNLIDPNDLATPALAMIVLGWLEAAEQVLTAGSSSQELQVLLSVADRQGQSR
jgi:hypothetical protein